MKKLFFDHLVLVDDIVFALDSHDLSTTEKQHAIALIDKTLQMELVAEILTHLPSEHHETFLTKLHQAPHNPEIMIFLQTHIMGIDQLIFKKAESIKKKLLKDIRLKETPSMR